MKKCIAWLTSWSLFWIGDLISKIMYWTHLWFLYPVYNKFMGWSCDIQNWAGNKGPWEDVVKEGI